MLGLILASSLSIVPLSLTLKPGRAQAQIPVTDVAHIGVSFSHLLEYIIEKIKVILIETLKRQILDMLVNQIVDWISGGGRPKLVTDWSGFLDDAVNVAVGDVVQAVGAGFLCEPFNLKVSLSLLPVQRFGDQARCTLDQIVGNIENFYDDFRNGGWLAYTQSIQPQNNIYGALLLTWNHEFEVITDKVNASRDEALAGGGFLSQKECEEQYGPWPPGGEPPDLDGDGAVGDDPNRCTIITPGQAVGQLAAKAIGSDIDYLINAREIEAYIGAIVNALINRVTTEGVGLLGAGSAPRQPPSPNVCAGLTGPAYNTCLQLMNQGNISFETAKQTLLDKIDSVLDLRQQAQLFMSNSLQNLDIYLQNLNNFLSSCVNLTNQISQEITWTQNKLNILNPQSTANTNIVAQLLDAKADIQALVTGDLPGLVEIQGQIQSLLSVSQAQSARNQAINENEDIIQRIQGKLQNFRNNCNPGPAPAIIPTIPTPSIP